jgi:cardiolipin synthase A/B
MLAIHSMPDTDWKFYVRSADAWEAMLADCAAARESIDIEQYIFEDDAIGQKFFEILKKKIGEGVNIRILCDAVGSSNFLNAKSEHALTAAGIAVKFFNPIRPWRVGNVSSWFLRDHRKILLIDRAIAHTGGAGIDGRMADWRDTNVRITGPIVSEMQESFDQMWIAAPRHKFFKFKPTFKKEEDFSFLTNSPRLHGRYIYHDLRRTIRKAKKYIYLTTPYFVPSVLLFTALQRAAMRGVDVRILIPGSSDVRIAHIANGSYVLLALHAGIKIYRYDEKKILHAKTGVIDDTWASIGSANIDNLSLLLNFEGNIKSSDTRFIAELKRQFEEDLTKSKIIKKEEWIRRPFSLKIFEALTWPLHGIL